MVGWLGAQPAAELLKLVEHWRGDASGGRAAGDGPRQPTGNLREANSAAQLYPAGPCPATDCGGAPHRRRRHRPPATARPAAPAGGDPH